MKIIKRFLAFLVCINLFLCSSIIYYTFAKEGEGAPAASGITERFDYNSGMYIESLDKDIEFISSVPNGGAVCDGAYFEIPYNIGISVERDGIPVEFNNKTPICNAGYYIMKINAANSFGEERNGVFTFRITAPPSNKVNTAEYNYPKISCIASISTDSAIGMNKYSFPNNKAFFTTVEGYGQTVESVKFWIPRNVGYSLQRNGKLISLVNNQAYTEAGNYSLKVFAYSYGQSNGYEACYETVLNFKIAKHEEDNDFQKSVTQAVSSIANINEQEEAPKAEPEEDITDSLLESYFESAGIYSESFSSGDAFYTNTPNDAIVGGNVYFDMPHNMSVSMTKDGNKVDFENKTYINDEGSYSMVITNDYEGEKSKARFSFRIQNGVKSSADVAESDEEEVTEAENKADAEAANDKNNEKSEEEFEYDLKNKYDKQKGMFVFECGSHKFYCSVPDRMFSNQSVVIEVPAGVEAALFRNGEEIELTDRIEDDGKYNLKVVDGDNEVEVMFYVSSYSTNSLEAFVVPEGYSFAAAEYSDYKGVYDGADGDEAKLHREGMMKIEEESASLPKVFELPLDGQYDFILQSNRGMPILSSTVILDRIAPLVEFEGLEKGMKTSEKSVDIYCDDPEAEILLTDADGNTEEVSLTDGRATINGEGKFQILARDMAGNESEYKFTLGKSGSSFLKFLLFAVLAVIVILLIIMLLKFTVLSRSKNLGLKNMADRDNSSRTYSKTNTDQNTNDWESSNYSDDNWENDSYDDDDWENSSIGGDDWENADESAATAESIDDDWENG